MTLNSIYGGMVGATNVFIEQKLYTIEAISISFVSFSHHLQRSYMPPDVLTGLLDRLVHLSFYRTGLSDMISTLSRKLE